MTEEELEQPITPELMPSKQLDIVIKEAGLENELAQEFHINFFEHFKMASTWAKKAKNIIVTDPSQTVIMQEARTARLFLREKRLEIEKFRVARKEYYLKGGRAIDKVANFLKDTIIPIETYLESQEKFVEIREKAKNDAILSEAKAKEEKELLAKQEKDRKELETLRAKEASENQTKMFLKTASDTNKLIKFRSLVKQTIDQFPTIKDPALIRWAEDAKSYLWLAHSTLNQVNEEEI